MIDLGEGQRVGRYVLLRDVEGVLMAVAPGAVGAVCQTDTGAVLLLPGGRMVQVARPFETVLGWLDGRG